MSGPVTVHVSLRWADMDVYGHVNNTEFFRLTEQARVVGLPLRRDPGITGFLVVRNEMEYRVPLDYRDDPVDVRMWCFTIGGAGFDLGYEVVADVDGVPVTYALAASTLVAYDFPSARPRRLSPDERVLLDGIWGPPPAFRRRATTP